MSGNHREVIVKVICDSMKENMEFLEKRGEWIIKEAIELINDAIDCITMLMLPNKKVRFIERYATAFYILHGFTPTSYGIFINLLTGNLPSCFRDLRFLTELLAKCYLADLKYPDEIFFESKLNLLEQEKNEKGEKKREHEYIKEFEDKVGLKEKECLKLWGKLSEEFHARKYVKRFVDSIIEKGIPPSYSIILPMNYLEHDIASLKRLYSYIREYRKILRKTMTNYFGQSPFTNKVE